ncbi:MAG: thioredoxin family protein [Promethearchaeota archaeon]
MSNDNEIDAIRQKKMEEMLNKNIVNFPENIVNIESVDHFNNVVNDYKDSLIIVDMWAPWCRPCLAFAPAFEALQKEYLKAGKSVIFSKLNVDEHGSIAQQFQVTGIPTTLFINNKKLVHRQVGMVPKAQFAQVIEAVLKKISE